MKNLKLIATFMFAAIMFTACEKESTTPISGDAINTSELVKDKVRNDKSAYPISITLDPDNSAALASQIASLGTGEKLWISESSSGTSSYIIDDVTNQVPDYGIYPKDEPNLEYVCDLSEVGCEDAARHIQKLNKQNGICSELIIDPANGIASVFHTDC